MRKLLLPPENLRWLWLSALVIAIDQSSKFWIARLLPQFEVLPVVPHLNLWHLQNTGAAFSMLNQAPAAVFVSLSVGVSIAILIWLSRHPYDQRLVAAGLSLVLGGALGNAIDRLRLGYVVDFIDFYIGDWHYAAFNAADSAITAGAALLILDAILEFRKPKSTKA